MTVEFNTTDFQFSHGRAPRGIGGWAFSFVRNPQMDEIFWVNGTYGEAKEVARAKAKAEGKREVFVCP